jgi:hypothetical protein
MDDNRFDTVVRSFANRRSRRALVGSLLGGGTALLAAYLRIPGAAARRNTKVAGEPCRHDDECVAADTALICAWNGYGYDGDLNCCALDGSRCANDAGCCGLGACVRGFCAGSGRIASAGSGGIATANAQGGSVAIGNVNSGGNVGNAIGVRNTRGNVAVSGGSVSNQTAISVDASSGQAIADASGGSGNFAGGGAWRPDARCPAYCLPGPARCPDCSAGYCTAGGYCGS